jgi:Sulfotransferase family
MATTRSDRLASPSDRPGRLSAREIWALRRFWLDTFRRRARLGRSLPAELPQPTFKNIFPHLGAIFIHIPKTAGTSIHDLFSRIPARECSVDPARRAELASVDRKGLTKHSKATEYVDRLGSESWASAFTFTFVRNPWDMMVSSYVWWLQGAPAHPHLRPLAAEVAQLADFGAFLRHRLGQSCINEFVGDPRDWFMADGADLVGFVGRYEELTDDIARICDRLGIERTRRPEPPRLNESRRRPYQDYYTGEARALVAQRFRYEIDRFGYTF